MSMATSLLKRFMGKASFMRAISRDRVMDSAFSPQPGPQVPDEEVGKHAYENVQLPAAGFAHFIIIHSQLILGLLQTLLHSPSDPAKPDKSLQPGIAKRMMSFCPQILQDLGSELSFTAELEVLGQLALLDKARFIEDQDAVSHRDHRLAEYYCLLHFLDPNQE